jgi:hypothetical protein
MNTYSEDLRTNIVEAIERGWAGEATEGGGVCGGGEAVGGGEDLRLAGTQLEV